MLRGGAGLGVGALEQQALGVGLAGNDVVLTALAEGGDADPVVGAVGEQDDGVAGVRLGIEGIVEGDPCLLIQGDLVLGDDLLGQDHLVRQPGGDAADLNGDRDRGIFACELHTHGRDDAVLGETERLR